MINKTKSDQNFSKLLSYYEKMCATGVVELIEEHTLLDLIRYYDAELQIDKAIEAVDLALTQFHHRVDFYLLKANLLYKNHMYTECMDVLDEMDLVNPNVIEAKLLKGKIMTLTGHKHDAFKMIHALVTNGEVHTQFEVLLCEAFLSESMSDFDKMFDLLQQALVIEPESHQALDRMWMATELSKRYSDSIALHNRLLNVNPYNALAWYNLGHAYQSLGEYNDAIDALEYAFIVDPKMEAAYADCVDICFQQKEYHRALKILMDVQDNFDTNFDTLLNLGKCYTYLKDTDHAKEYLKQAVEFDKHEDEAFYLLAQCYIREKNWNKALYSLQEAIALEPENEDYYKSLARVFVSVGDFESAKENYEKAAYMSQEQTMYWEEYIAFLLKIGDYRAARRITYEAEKYTYSNRILLCKAAVFFKLEKRDRGLMYLEEALAEEPEGHDFFYAICPEYRDDMEMSAAIKYFSA